MYTEQTIFMNPTVRLSRTKYNVRKLPLLKVPGLYAYFFIPNLCYGYLRKLKKNQVSFLHNRQLCSPQYIPLHPPAVMQVWIQVKKGVHQNNLIILYLQIAQRFPCVYLPSINAPSLVETLPPFYSVSESCTMCSSSNTKYKY